MCSRLLLSIVVVAVLAPVGSGTAGSPEKQRALQAHVPIDRAVAVAVASAESIPNHTIRAMRVTFIPDGTVLLKGYRGREPSQIKPKRPYWDVSFDYYKHDSTTIEFGGRVFIDAISGERVN